MKIIFVEDYTLGELKMGGNAQMITRDRWVHHTSFLWRFSPEYMETLRYPEKTPEYRAGRDHGDFLCTLENEFASQDEFAEEVEARLEDFFEVERHFSEQSILNGVDQSHKTRTAYIETQEL